jgi:hypothetical protein
MINMDKVGLNMAEWVWSIGFLTHYAGLVGGNIVRRVFHEANWQAFLTRYLF